MAKTNKKTKAPQKKKDAKGKKQALSDLVIQKQKARIAKLEADLALALQGKTPEPSSDPDRIQTQEPPIRIQESPTTYRDGEGKLHATHDRRYWPKGKPFPTIYYKQVLPCPRCGRVLLDNSASRAVVCTSSSGHLAHFRCRKCGGRWQLPVQKT